MTEDEIRHCWELKGIMSEIEIAKYMGVSRTTLREALQGTHRPNKKLSTREIKNLLDGWRL